MISVHSQWEWIIEPQQCYQSLSQGCTFCSTPYSHQYFLLVCSICCLSWLSFYCKCKYPVPFLLKSIGLSSKCLKCSSNSLFFIFYWRIKDTNPAESRAITEQVENMERLLAKLRLETQKKWDILQQAQNQLSFLQDSRRLLLWAEGIREKLSSEEMGVDVASAEQLLKEHQDLLKEIRSQQER